MIMRNASLPVIGVLSAYQNAMPPPASISSVNRVRSKSFAALRRVLLVIADAPRTMYGISGDCNPPHPWRPAKSDDRIPIGPPDTISMRQRCAWLFSALMPSSFKSRACAMSIKGGL